MALRRYLAMTAAEIVENPTLVSNIGWMACHFDQNGTGLTDFPDTLPPGSLLILDDSLPPDGHDPGRVTGQLAQAMKVLSCGGLLLDFQRPYCDEVRDLIGSLLRGLRRPVAVPEGYAREFDCPVFLPPLPLSRPFREVLQPWTGRDIWLEIGLTGESIALTKDSAAVTSLPHITPPEAGHRDEELCCHYRVNLAEDAAEFTLWRTREDWDRLLEEAENYGVTTAVGLWKEFSNVGRGHAPAEQVATISKH